MDLIDIRFKDLKNDNFYIDVSNSRALLGVISGGNSAKGAGLSATRGTLKSFDRLVRFFLCMHQLLLVGYK